MTRWDAHNAGNGCREANAAIGDRSSKVLHGIRCA
jgi:hypothetical protein